MSTAKGTTPFHPRLLSWYWICRFKIWSGTVDSMKIAGGQERSNTIIYIYINSCTYKFILFSMSWNSISTFLLTPHVGKIIKLVSKSALWKHLWLSTQKQILNLLTNCSAILLRDVFLPRGFSLLFHISWKTLFFWLYLGLLYQRLKPLKSPFPSQSGRFCFLSTGEHWLQQWLQRKTELALALNHRDPQTRDAQTLQIQQNPKIWDCVSRNWWSQGSLQVTGVV